MISVLLEMFGYTFLVRAFIVGALVSVCAALLGVSLVLKRYSMIGDGLSHVGFGSLAIATAFNVAPLSVSIPIVIAAAFLLLRLGEKHLVKGDAAIAIISTSSMAIGVVIISQTVGMNTDVCNYLFGSILAMNKNDVYLSVVLSIIVLAVFIVFYNKLFAITFDETFASSTGVNTRFYNMVIAFLTAITIVLGMRMMGALLISALIIFPALTSMRIFKRFISVSISSVCVSLICYFAGIIVSYIYSTPAGASVVLANIIAFAVFWAVNAVKNKSIVLRKSAVTAGVSAVVCAALVTACENPKNQSALSVIQAGKGSGDTPAVFLTDDKAPVFAAPDKQDPAAQEVTPAQVTGRLIDIKEKMFIEQINDVYINAPDYLGKMIRLEGLFKREQGDFNTYCFVIRYGPGCCGNDGNAGFEVAWDPRDRSQVKYPNIDDWVEATGVLKQYDEDGIPYLYLALSSLKVKDKRGAEFVTQ